MELVSDTDWNASLKSNRDAGREFRGGTAPRANRNCRDTRELRIPRKSSSEPRARADGPVGVSRVERNRVNAPVTVVNDREQCRLAIPSLPPMQSSRFG